MVKIREAIVVEGRYDKNTLSQIVDAPILETSGFGIFKNKEQMALLRRVAEKRGLIVFTDADGAGFVIRNHIKSAIPGKFLKHAYTPDIFGKERRKEKAGKEGKLGVEGLSEEIITEALTKAGVFHKECEKADSIPVTVNDLYEDSLTGHDNSAERKRKLLKALSLPSRMSNSQLLKLINTFMTYEDYKKAVMEISDG